ncbi:glycoside hydrolase 5 family protein [Wenjunlia vitaminophila]|uniref:cellulase family glycosylhydrolase n=1 Tax=Wenjunlia vitaminophila TaxID=76728 RepID=UPI000A59450E|nr:cellulase family glycosylhydrolase [Wenjunlia vitaminophila]
MTRPVHSSLPIPARPDSHGSSRSGRHRARPVFLLGLVLVLVAVLSTSVGSARRASAATFSLSVTSPSLVFHQGSGGVVLGSSAASVSWRIADEKDATVRTGTSWMSQGKATINVADLGPGYYQLSLHAGSSTDPTDLRTSFAVIEPVPGSLVNASSPFGAAVHIGRTGWGLNVLDEAKKVGIAHVREDAWWNQFETAPGVYTFPAAFTAKIDRIQSLGLTPLIIANGANPLYDNGRTPSSPEGIAAFGRFAAALLDHYGEDNVEVLNEYNGGTFNTSVCGTSAACYLEVLKGVHQAVKASNPNAKVVAPATIGIGNCVKADGTKCFAPDLIDRGGLNHLDAYSVHPYHYPGGPEWMGGSGDTIAGLRQRIRDANGGQDKPIVLSEMGWPTDTGHGTTELQQADNLVRLYAVGLANGVTRVYWYDLVNDGTDPANKEHNFGMLRQPVVATAENPVSVTANAPKPALVAQAVTARMIAGRTYAGSDAVVAPARSARFANGTGTTRVLWATSAKDVVVRATGPVTLTDSYGRRTVREPTDGQFTLSLGVSPVFAEGPVTSVVG